MGKEVKYEKRRGEIMGGKNIVNKIMYFLGIEDENDENDENELTEDHEAMRYPEYINHRPKSKVINIHQTTKNKMLIFKPNSFDDVSKISEEVKNRRVAIVNMESLNKENAQRILDFMSGSVYALNGTVKKVGAGIFVFAPDNVDISGINMEEGLKEDSNLLSR